MDKARWVWMPHAGHFIGGHDCRFHLCTHVGGYIVSTVGDYQPDKAQAVTGRVGYEDIGYERKYETMVFKAKRAVKDDGLCCPWRQASGSEKDFAGYNDPTEAYRGHLKLCAKWAKR